jgi:hypothetical protein
MKSVAKVVWRTYRWELAILGLGSLAVVAGVLLASWRLAATRPSPACLASMQSCALGDFGGMVGVAAQLTTLTAALPILLGVLVGAPLVATEIERRTSDFVWVLAGSRTRWLVERVAVAVGVLLVLMVPVAVASTVLEAMAAPQVSPFASMHNVGVRGASLLSAAFAVLGIGILAGTVAGRVLPSMLVTGIAAVLMVLALPQVAPLVQPEQVIWTQGQPQSVGDAWRRTVVVAPDGRILPDDAGSFATGDNPVGPDGNRLVSYGVPGSRYPIVEAELVAAECAIGGACLLATALVLRRRRSS